MDMRSLWSAGALPDAAALIRDLERVLDVASRGPAPDPWRGSFPPLNVSRDDENYYVRAVLPGIDPEKLRVAVERNKVSIAGERAVQAEPADGGGRGAPSYHRRERGLGGFGRTITLDSMFVPDRVAATYRDGILKITLPVTKEAQARLIPVQS